MLIICQIDWREVGVAFELQCLRNCTLSSLVLLSPLIIIFSTTGFVCMNKNDKGVTKTPFEGILAVTKHNVTLSRVAIQPVRRVHNNVYTQYI